MHWLYFKWVFRGHFCFSDSGWCFYRLILRGVIFEWNSRGWYMTILRLWDRVSFFLLLLIFITFVVVVVLCILKWNYNYLHIASTNIIVSVLLVCASVSLIVSTIPRNLEIWPQWGNYYCVVSMMDSGNFAQNVSPMHDFLKVPYCRKWDFHVIFIMTQVWVLQKNHE